MKFKSIRNMNIEYLIYHLNHQQIGTLEAPIIIHQN